VELSSVDGATLITNYIRNQDIFGEDAHTFDPERWLHYGIKKATTVGVLANLYVSIPHIMNCLSCSRFAPTFIA
jgi:hypothetical protein